MAQSSRILVHDVRGSRHARAHLEHLVELLLILDDGQADLGVLEHVDHLGGYRVLVKRHRNRAQNLRGHHRAVQMRPVLADDCHMVAAPHAELVKRGRQRARLVGELPPIPGLPDAKVFFPQRRALGARARVMQKQSRKGIGAGGEARHLQVSSANSSSTAGGCPGQRRDNHAMADLRAALMVAENQAPGRRERPRPLLVANGSGVLYR